MADYLEGQVSKNNITPYEFKTKNTNIGNAINNVVKSALFLEALRNLNWSRGYNWYVELDGVPPPFQRNGVLGLPVISVDIHLVSGKEFTWEAGLDTLAVPQSISHVNTISLTMYDDEQATIATFFERWYNMIYNYAEGVLPVVEACKQITITKTKSTRATAHRYINTKDESKKKVTGRDFLVYPKGNLIENEKITEGPRQYTVDLTIVKYINPDFGSPAEKLGDKSFFGHDFNTPTTEEGFLSRVADYI